MGMFDNLSGKLQDAAKKSGEFAQAAAKKSGEMIEISKYSLKIKEEESKIKSKYAEIGKIVYEKYGSSDMDSISDEVSDIVKFINDCKVAIADYKNKIDDIKRMGNITDKDISDAGFNNDSGNITDAMTSFDSHDDV